MKVQRITQRTGYWHDTRKAEQPDSVSSGFDDLDTLLPDGGWPRGALTEIHLAQQSMDALHLLLPALSKLSHDENRWICLVAPPILPCMSDLLESGVNLSRVLLVHPGAQQDGLWAVEESLRSGTCSAVLAWPTTDDSAALRCLQLAAEAGNTSGFLFRPQHLANRPSPATLRLQLHEQQDYYPAVSVIQRRSGRNSAQMHRFSDRVA
ncbi:RecA/RadA recombinase [hydrothermal vent metagenome]|uniref:RecA/RadA recombinase n=1 Tax=hydrothermal vent metagenome TaxID=652676 RepID=A0A3B0Z3D2_9ZZZZ